jgi:hypothetical protein
MREAAKTVGLGVPAPVLAFAGEMIE